MDAPKASRLREDKSVSVREKHFIVQHSVHEKFCFQEFRKIDLLQ
jgi:hypothetical protein